MKLEITNEKKNPLLGRKEVQFQLVEKVTPSRKDIKAELAKALKAKENLIIIDLVDQKTGSNLIVGRAKVYEKEDVMNKVDLDYRNKRGIKEKKEEAPAPAPAEATPAEAPAEEKPAEEAPKEEAPAEEKPAEEVPKEEKPPEEAPKEEKSE